MTDDKLFGLVDKAYKALEMGDIDAASKGLERARAEGPDDPDVILLDVELRLEKAVNDEDVDAAVEVLEAAVDRDPLDPTLAAKLATYLVEIYGDHEAAEPLLASAAKGAETIEPEDEEEAREIREFLVDVLLLAAECRTMARDPRGALAASERAVELDREDPLCHTWVATARFDLCELDLARKALAEATRLAPDHADAHWLLGRIETVEGNDEAARSAFGAAVRSEPERFDHPTRISEDELVALVEQGLAEMPEQVREYLDNVAIVVEDVPTLDRLTDNDPPLSPGSLGLFEGTPPALESTQDPWSCFPRQIVLFRKNIEIDSRDREDLKEIAVTTLIHEVGHFLGLDEEDLEERGLA